MAIFAKNSNFIFSLILIFPFAFLMMMMMMMMMMIGVVSRYLVHVNGICAGYSLLSAVFTAMPRPSTMSRAWTFFLLDQVQ